MARKPANLDLALEILAQRQAIEQLARSVLGLIEEVRSSRRRVASHDKRIYTMPKAPKCLKYSED